MVSDTCDPRTQGAENHEFRACLNNAARTCQQIKRKIETKSEVQMTEANTVVHAFDPRTWKAEASESAVEGDRRLA